jgi:hypothetical protein
MAAEDHPSDMGEDKMMDKMMDDDKMEMSDDAMMGENGSMQPEMN